MDSKTKRCLYIVVGAISINFLVNIVFTSIKCLADYATYIDFAMATPFVTSIVGAVALLVEFIALMMANKDNIHLYRASRVLFVSLILYFICFAFRLFVFFFEEGVTYYDTTIVITLYAILTSVFLIATVFEVLGIRNILIVIDEASHPRGMRSRASSITLCALITYEVIAVAAWITIIISYYISRDASLTLNLVVDIMSIFTSLLYVISLLFLTKCNFEAPYSLN